MQVAGETQRSKVADLNELIWMLLETNAEGPGPGWIDLQPTSDNADWHLQVERRGNGSLDLLPPLGGIVNLPA